MPLKLLSVASEVFPLVKTGGLADVVGALPAALAREDVAVTTLVPGYPAVLDALGNAHEVARLPVPGCGEARLLAARATGLDLLVLDAPPLFARPGNPYTGPDGRDWFDNAERFAALAQAAAAVARGLVPGLTPDVLHAHDWQAALAPAYLHHAGGGCPSVVTIHNLAFTGWFRADLLAALGLPPESFSIDGVEFYGGIGFLKAGLRFADRITTVSPAYAAEIATAAGGYGLDGLLRGRGDAVSGILNGIDTAVWDPAADPHLPARYDAARIETRAANKTALLEGFGLDPDPASPLFGVVSRLSAQKGLDLLIDVLPELLARGGRLVLIGSGDAGLEEGFVQAARRHPGRVAVLIGYDEARAHLVQAGADAILVPSRFEPCGLTQLCALRYGAVPVVARTGGLSDTVIDANPAALAAGVATGVQFEPGTAEALARAIARTVALYRDHQTWAAIQANGMAADVSWRHPAAAYAALYREIAR